VHAFYRGDRLLQNAHAKFPWILVWDDHDVENDYAGEHSPFRTPRDAFLAQRAAAYQAYWEHLPFRLQQKIWTPGHPLYRRFDFGRLVRLHVLDTRQYRSPLACPRPAPAPDSGYHADAATCAELTDPSRSMMGFEQERWLANGLAESRARWDLIGQGVMMAPFDQTPGPGISAPTDSWDGFQANRSRLLGQLKTLGRGNVVVLSGDRHAYFANDLPVGPSGNTGATVAAEFVCGPISSRFDSHQAYLKALPENPHVRFMDAEHHGYTRLTVRAGEIVADFRAVESARTEQSPISTLASFQVAYGVPGVKPHAGRK
jgi:alkaline phosphatase D